MVGCKSLAGDCLAVETDVSLLLSDIFIVKLLVGDERSVEVVSPSEDVLTVERDLGFDMLSVLIDLNRFFSGSPAVSIFSPFTFGLGFVC